MIWNKVILEIIKFRYLYLLPSIHNDVVITSLRRHYLTLLWRRYIIAMAVSDEVAERTLSL